MKRAKIYYLQCAATSMLGLAAMLFSVQSEGGAWQVSMGVGASYAPRYEGAASNRLWGLPLLDVNYNKGGFFIGVARGIGFNFSEVQGLQYGVRVLLGQARSEDADARLYGTGKIDYFPEGGLFMSGRLGPLSLSSGVAAGEHGAHGDVACALAIPAGKENRFRFGISQNWGDSNYTQTYFGVTAAQSIASGNVLPVYLAGEGVKDTVYSASWTHNFDKSWYGTTSLTHKRLQGYAVLSPLTQRTSTNSLSYILAYRF